MGPEVIYTYGISVSIILALCWSFILDKQKPPSTKEFVAKLVARTLFLITIFAVLMVFLYLAFGVFR